MTVADHQILKRGNFQRYAAVPYAAWTGMWGHYRTKQLQAESSVLAFPATFPDGTIFTWEVTPAPDWGGVNGFLHVSYGNYDYSPGGITPRQVEAINELAVAIDWTMEGDPSSGLLAECWLTPKATPSGSLDKKYEIGFLPRLSPAAVAWVKTLPKVGAGSFVDRFGVRWEVRQSGTYFVAYLPDFSDFRGTLRFDDLLAFLVANKKITGAEWVNGVAFGVEPHRGSGSLTVEKFAVSYA